MQTSYPTNDPILDGLLLRRRSPLPQQGKRWGRLTFTGVLGQRRRGKNDRFFCITCHCICDCGTTATPSLQSLDSGKSTSCGCTQAEHAFAMSQNNRKYNRGPEDYWILAVYNTMKQRCSNPSSNSYSNYGGRGITVCPEWASNPEAFRLWAWGSGVQRGLTIERKDVNGNYCPENCTWVTRLAQGANKRNNHILNLFGETRHLAAWHRDIRCVSRDVYYSRVNRGIAPEIAILK